MRATHRGKVEVASKRGGSKALITSVTASVAQECYPWSKLPSDSRVSSGIDSRSTIESCSREGNISAVLSAVSLSTIARKPVFELRTRVPWGESGIGNLRVLRDFQCLFLWVLAHSLPFSGVLASLLASLRAVKCVLPALFKSPFKQSSRTTSLHLSV